jgi:hypothetical protein
MLKEQGLRGSDGSDNLRGSHWSDLMRGLGGDDYLYGYGSDDRLFGDSGNDQLWGGEGEDQLDGGAGNDTLLGEAGADVIEGGRGDDVLVGGSGDDVYVFGRGDGQDVIGAEWPNWWERPLGHNVLMFKADIAAKDVSLTRREDGLVVSIEGTEDTVTASNFFRDHNPGNQFNTLQEIRFADGSSWDVASMLSRTGLAGTLKLESLGIPSRSPSIGGFGGDDLMSCLGDDLLIGGFQGGLDCGEFKKDSLICGAGVGLDEHSCAKSSNPVLAEIGNGLKAASDVLPVALDSLPLSVGADSDGLLAPNPSMEWVGPGVQGIGDPNGFGPC